MSKKAITIFMVLLIVFHIVVQADPQKAEASTNRITISAFALELAKEIGIVVEGSSATDILMNHGIIKSGDFTDDSKNLTRGDMLILLSRADDYLYNTEIDDELVKKVIEKRISDIDKVKEAKRVDIAKGYIKGFLKGYSNGKYITNRNLKLTSYVTKAGALSCIKMLKDKSLRAKTSPDGQLIRTTNLPKNANNYEYILESFPNKFYERKFEFMFSNEYKAGYRNPKEQIYPVDMRNSTFRTWNDSWSFSIEMNQYLYEWQEKAETYLNYLFNVDYRTVDEEWINGLASCYEKSNINQAESIKDYYIKHLKANKVIVESSIISVEPSTLYYDGDYCMRAYVRYRITADDINVKHNRLLRCQYPVLNNLKSGVWREGIFDIRFGTNNGYQGDGSYFAISTSSKFVDEYNVPIE